MLCDGLGVAQFCAVLRKSATDLRESALIRQTIGLLSSPNISLLPVGGRNFFLKQRCSVLRRCMRADGRNPGLERRETWRTRHGKTDDRVAVSSHPRRFHCSSRRKELLPDSALLCFASPLPADGPEPRSRKARGLGHPAVLNLDVVATVVPSR
jgi:hypothetical protein